MPDYWVYKIHQKNHKHGVFWSLYFQDSDARELAGEVWHGYADSRVDFRAVGIGDLIFAYQVDTKIIIGIIKVLQVRKKDQQVDVFIVQKLVKFQQPFPILNAKKADKDLESIRAFKEDIGHGTLFLLDETEAYNLLYACARYTKKTITGLSENDILTSFCNTKSHQDSSWMIDGSEETNYEALQKAVEQSNHHQNALPENLDSHRPCEVDFSVRSGGTGESEAHRMLKEYVSENAMLVFDRFEFIKNLLKNSDIHKEYTFLTGDRVDIAFIAKDEKSAVVIEIELSGDRENTIGAAQALKYKNLMCFSLGLPTSCEQIQAFLIAHQISDSIKNTCKNYQINTLEIPKFDSQNKSHNN